VPAEPPGELPDLVPPAAAVQLAIHLLNGHEVDVERGDHGGDGSEVDRTGAGVEPAVQVPRRDAQDGAQVRLLAAGEG